MKICHIYRSKRGSSLIQKLLELYDDADSIEISEISSFSGAQVYIIELEKVDDNLARSLKKHLSLHSHPLVYFYIGEKYAFALFQLALQLNVKAYIRESYDPVKLSKKINSDYKANEDSYLENLLGKSLLCEKHFLLFENQRLFYASKKFLEDFSLQSFKDIEEKFLNLFDLQTLLQKESFALEVLEDKNAMTYHLRSAELTNKDEKILFLDPFVACKEELTNKTSSPLAFLSNRISFIELLKDKLIETDISTENRFVVATFHMENIDKLRTDLNSLEIEDAIRDFLIQTKVLLNDMLAMSLYDKDFYVALFENEEYTDFQKKIHTFNNEISLFFQQQKYRPLLGIFTFVIKEKDLNDTLLLLEKIYNKNITQSDTQKHSLEYISNMQEDMSETEVISSSLEGAFVNNSTLKLLNIYKGLVINTPAKIIKYKDNTAYIKFEQLQGTIMQFERETVLQANNFYKDIRASVKHVSLDKGVAILDQFTFIDSNANARKHSRVTFATKAMIVLSYKNSTLNGEILDISVSSIAIKAKNVKLIQEIHKQTVQLTFVLPNALNPEDHMRMKIDATVVFEICEEGYKDCKIVCEFIHDESSEAFLMEYVYKRQKEIIVELKKIAKKKTLL